MFELSHYLSQRTKANGCFSKPTRLPWRFFSHTDVKCMEEYINGYVHDPTGSRINIHVWYPFGDEPMRYDVKFYYGHSNLFPFDTEEELIAEMTKHYDTIGGGGMRGMGLDMALPSFEEPK